MNIARRFRRDRRGDVWSFLAVALLFIGMPLASLTVDVTRAMYVRTHLQAASDAACQAAADALDAAAFRSSGIRQIDPGRGRAQAALVFYASLADAGKVGYSPSLSVGFLGPTTSYCQATASVNSLIPLTPPMTAAVETTSDMRVEQNP